MEIQFKHDQLVFSLYLSNNQIHIYIYKEFAIKRLEVVRDIFVFCAFTGLAFIDVKHLKPEHLLKDSTGTLWIRKPREKTGNMCNIPVLSPVKAVIDKYKYHPQCLKNGVLLPVLTNQKMNSYLKEIADLCGFTKKLSTHGGYSSVFSQ